MFWNKANIEIYKVVLKSIGILTSIFFIDFYIFNYSGIEIPKFIPNTPININGLILFSVSFYVLRISIKKILMHNKGINILYLGVISFIIIFCSEFIFQIVKLTLVDKISEFSLFDDVLMRSFKVASVMTICSFFIAYYLKTKKYVELIFIIIAFIFIVAILNMAFPFLIPEAN